VLEWVEALTDDECAARGGGDAYADLWRAMEAAEPVVVFSCTCSTRRARKQLLHRLSKQPAAAGYDLHVLVPVGEQAAAPSLDEGWAAVL
jgi:hypothetical protein